MRTLTRLGVTGAFFLASLSAPPAVAHLGACEWVAVNLHLSKPIYWPIIGPAMTSVHTYFSSNVGSPTCIVHLVWDVAQCGNSAGYGWLHDGTDGHPFRWQDVAGQVVLSDGVIGTGYIDTNYTLGDLCTQGADDFLFTGWAVSV